MDGDDDDNNNNNNNDDDDNDEDQEAEPEGDDEIEDEDQEEDRQQQQQDEDQKDGQEEYKPTFTEDERELLASYKRKLECAVGDYTSTQDPEDVSYAFKGIPADRNWLIAFQIFAYPVGGKSTQEPIFLNSGIFPHIPISDNDFVLGFEAFIKELPSLLQDKPNLYIFLAKVLQQLPNCSSFPSTYEDKLKDAIGDKYAAFQEQLDQ